MKLQKLLTLLLFIITNVIFSQEKISHSVSKGESVYSIAQKYNVKPAEILALNPKAKKTLQLNMVLQIPSNNKVEEKKSETVEHEVLAKETLYGLSRKYNTSIEKIKVANPIIETEGLKVGLKLVIPVGEIVAKKQDEKSVVKETIVQKEEAKKIEKEVIVQKEDFKNESISGEQIVHEVQAKETKYGISRKYGISIAELESLNPEAKNGLAIGAKLLIKEGVIPSKTESKIETQKIEKNDKVIVSVPKEDKKESSQLKIVEMRPHTESEGSNEVINEPVSQPENATTPALPLSAESMEKADFLIAKASENLGARYRSGATGNGGFDCSGLMFTTYKNIDMTLPRSSRDMAANAGFRIDRSQAQKGDLIFFATRGSGVSHVGMITEVTESDIKFIHSSTSSGVIISSTKEPYYSKRFVQINRVLKDKVEGVN